MIEPAGASPVIVAMLARVEAACGKFVREDYSLRKSRPRKDVKLVVRYGNYRFMLFVSGRWTYSGDVTNWRIDAGPRASRGYGSGGTRKYASPRYALGGLVLLGLVSLKDSELYKEYISEKEQAAEREETIESLRDAARAIGMHLEEGTTSATERAELSEPLLAVLFGEGLICVACCPALKTISAETLEKIDASACFKDGGWAKEDLCLQCGKHPAAES